MLTPLSHVHDVGVTPMAAVPYGPVWIRTDVDCFFHVHDVGVTPLAAVPYGPVWKRIDVDCFFHVHDVGVTPMAAVPYAPVWIRTYFDPSPMYMMLVLPQWLQFLMP